MVLSSMRLQKVSVTLWFRRLQCLVLRCFVCFYQPALCRVCVFILWTSCLLINKQIKLELNYRYIFDKQRLFCLMRQKRFWSYFVSSCAHLFEVITWQVCMERVTYIANLIVWFKCGCVCLCCVKYRLSDYFGLNHNMLCLSALC